MVKDVDGVFTSDPAVEGAASEFIGRVGAAELLSMDLAALPVDETVLKLMARTKHVREIQIVNGLTPGRITDALRGQHVGTLIHSDDHPPRGYR